MVGLSAGLATVTVPLYLAELVPPLRGVLAIITQLCITSGVLLGQVLGFPFSEPMRWRHAFAISVLMAVVQIIGGFIAHQVGITDGLKGKRRRLQDGEDSPLMVDEHELPTLPPMHLKEILASEDRTLTAGGEFFMGHCAQNNGSQWWSSWSLWSLSSSVGSLLVS